MSLEFFSQYLCYIAKYSDSFIYSMSLYDDIYNIQYHASQSVLAYGILKSYMSYWGTPTSAQ
jgi:hypothetical protein